MVDVGNTLIIIRGAGDLATGVAIRLHNSGFPIVMLETSQPTVIRRTVSFAEAVYEGSAVVEGVRAVLCDAGSAARTAESGSIAVVIDPEGGLIGELRPEIVVDAILAKKNLGTNQRMAPFVIALGPGFTARRRNTDSESGADLSGKMSFVDAVVETKRGHRLGLIITEGSAEPNTGIPGIIGGYGSQRVLHSPCAGVFRAVHTIGDIVSKGDALAFVDNSPVITEIGGKVRGMLRSGLFVPEGFKVADVDPRGADTDHTTVSDKARAVAGGVLEAVMHYLSDKYSGSRCPEK